MTHAKTYALEDLCENLRFLMVIEQYPQLLRLILPVLFLVTFVTLTVIKFEAHFLNLTCLFSDFDYTFQLHNTQNSISKIENTLLFSFCFCLFVFCL